MCRLSLGPHSPLKAQRINADAIWITSAGGITARLHLSGVSFSLLNTSGRQNGIWNLAAARRSVKKPLFKS